MSIPEQGTDPFGQSDTNTLTESDCCSLIHRLYDSLNVEQFQLAAASDFKHLRVTSKVVEIYIDVMDDGKVKTLVSTIYPYYYAAELITDSEEGLADIVKLFRQAVEYYNKYLDYVI